MRSKLVSITLVTISILSLIVPGILHARQSSVINGNVITRPDGRVPPPKDVIGFTPGDNRKLASWSQVVDYFNALAKSSDRITVQEIGKTTLGRPFIYATISSPENLKHLDRYLEIQRKLSDPRLIKNEAEARALMSEGKTVVLCTFQIHSTEIGGSLASINTAYQLASSDSPKIKEILDNCIVLFVPSLNPDGVDIVKNWYDKTLGTPYEGSSPPELYHHYTGHDNNRDWYAFTQVETQLTIDKIQNIWHPQIVHDVHQQGATASRLFLPPFTDPYEPNVPPILIEGVNFMGSAMAWELSQDGKKGITTFSTYDGWTPARSYQHYHAGIRILSETASARLASPITIPPDKLTEGRGYDARVSSVNFPDPWPGGEWTVGNIVDYMSAGVFALLTNSARYRDRWLHSFYQVSKDAVRVGKPGQPFAMVLPAPRDACASNRRDTVLNILLRAGVEVYHQDKAFTGGGNTYAEGAIVIPMAQPYGAFARVMLEKEIYPDMRDAAGQPKPPYDVTAHSLSLLMGVGFDSVNNEFEFERNHMLTGTLAVGSTLVVRPLSELPVGAADLCNLPELNKSLKAQQPVWLANDSFFLTNKQNLRKPPAGIDPPGTHRMNRGEVIIAKAGIPTNRLQDDLMIRTKAGSAAAITLAEAERQGLITQIRLPRVAMYKSYLASMDEGWTRFIFDQNKLQYSSIFDKEIRAGNLKSKYDCIILPDQRPAGLLEGARRGSLPEEYVGGIGKEGVLALKEFVESGGTLMTFNDASMFAVQQFGLPVRNVLSDVKPRDFYCPGSILKIDVDQSNPISAGIDSQSIAWFENGPAFELTSVGPKIKTVAQFASAKDVLQAGWILGPEYLANRAAIVEIKQGKGRFILFAFRPQYRAQSLATYPFVFNSIFTSVTE